MKAIILTRGRIATVDDEDFDRVNQFKWYAVKAGRTYYAVRNEKRPRGTNPLIYMHRFILGMTSRDEHVDHENGCGVDNWRDNFRLATPAQNNANSRKRTGTSSRFKGVRWHSGGKWTAAIGTPPKRLHLGSFTDEATAARAYDEAAQKLFGEFAKLNFLKGLK